MLVEHADTICRELLDDLFASDTEEAMHAGFDALRAELDYRRSLAEAAEREHRQKTGAPARWRRIPADVLEAAVEEWDMLIAGPTALADDDDHDADDEDDVDEDDGEFETDWLLTFSGGDDADG